MQLRHLRLLALVSLIPAGWGQSAGFLSTGPGARALSLGGAFTGLADDSSAAFYNPAGLAGQRGTLMVEHVPINETGMGLNFGGGRLDFLGFQYPTRIGTIGLSMQQFAIGDIEARTTLSDAPTAIKVTQTQYAVPYGVAFGRYAVGVTGKAVSYTLGRYHDTGFGADVGTKISLFENDTRLGRETRVAIGLTIRNAMKPTLKLFNDPVALERVTAAGISVTSLVHEDYVRGEDRVTHDRIAFAFDVTRGSIDSTIAPAAGLEYSFRDRYSLRGGVNAAKNITMGIGYGGQTSTFRVDYAAELTTLTPQHHFSLSWQFTAPPPLIESNVSFSGYRHAVFDQERLKDRFIGEGRAAAVRGNYAEAYAAFTKAQVLDPQDKEVCKLVESSKEGNRLSGVKVRLDAARQAQYHGYGAEAANGALDAVAFDPASQEAAKFLVDIHNSYISSGTAGEFNLIRSCAVEKKTQEFDAAFADNNAVEMQRLLAAIKAMNPDDRARWEPLQEKLVAAQSTWAQAYSLEAQEAFKRGDAIDMSRALRRIRRIDAEFRGISILTPQLRRLVKRNKRSFYNSNYLTQLYYTAAVDYSLGNYPDAVAHVAQLLKEQATHENANSLVDRMRNEGRIKEIEEP